MFCELGNTWQVDAETVCAKPSFVHVCQNHSLGIPDKAWLACHIELCCELMVDHLSGEWLPEEEDSLVAAMKELHGDSVLDDVAVSSSVTWEQVAKHVGSRNSIQCRAKWLFSWPGSFRAKWEKKWRYHDDLRLLRCLGEEQEAGDEDEVDWVALSSSWGNAKSPYYLRNKWSCLRRHVPNHSLNSYAGEGWEGGHELTVAWPNCREPGLFDGTFDASS